MVTHPCTADFDFKMYKLSHPLPLKKFTLISEIMKGFCQSHLPKSMKIFTIKWWYSFTWLTIAVILDSREFSLFFNFYQILIAFNKLKIISEEETDYVFFNITTFTRWPIFSCSKQWPLQHWQIKTLCLQKQLALFFIRNKYKYGNNYITVLHQRSTQFIHSTLFFNHIEIVASQIFLEYHKI